MNSPSVAMRTVDIEGVNQMLWPTRDFNAFHWPLQDWIRDREAFLKFVKARDVVVQAGGCCGMYPRFYKNHFKEVYTFEPDPTNYYCLERNCDVDGIYHQNVALGSEEKLVSLDAPTAPGEENNVGMYTVNENPGAVKMITIDSLGLHKCDLIHFDLEGYEPEALKGAINLIEKCSPVIITERACGREFLESIGYRAVQRTSMDTIFVRG
jgi:FkbM family methyltransferase